MQANKIDKIVEIIKGEKPIKADEILKIIKIDIERMSREQKIPVDSIREALAQFLTLAEAHKKFHIAIAGGVEEEAAFDEIVRLCSSLDEVAEVLKLAWGSTLRQNKAIRRMAEFYIVPTE